MATEKNFNNTDPAPPTGFVNATWQENPTAAGTDANTGQPYFNVSVCVPVGAGQTVVGFIIGDGTTGTNVGPMLVAPSNGTVSSCVVVTKASDPSVPFQFDIKKNGTSVFTGTLPTVSAGTTTGTVNTFTSLTSVPLTVTAGDVFSINIAQGNFMWLATVQLET